MTIYERNIKILDKLNSYEKKRFKNNNWLSLPNEEKEKKEARAKELRKKAYENGWKIQNNR